MQNIISQIFKTNSEIKKIDNQEEIVLKDLQKKSDKISSEERDKIRAIERKYMKKKSSIERIISNKENMFKRKIQVLVDFKRELLKKIKILMITENLQEPDEIEIKEEEFHNLKYFYLTCSFFTNRNKVNKISYVVRVVPKHRKFPDILSDKNIPSSETVIFSKDFKTIEDAKKYHEKHFDKISESVILWDVKLREIYEEAMNLGIDYKKLFDFRLIDISSAGKSLVKQSKNSIVVKYFENYGKEVLVTVNYVGNGVFEIDNKKYVEDLDFLLKYSRGDLWFENPVIKFKKKASNKLALAAE